MQCNYKVAIVGLGSIGNRHLKNIVYVLNKKDATFMIDLIRSGKGRDLDSKTMQMINQIYYSYNAVPADYDVILLQIYFSAFRSNTAISR